MKKTLLLGLAALTACGAAYAETQVYNFTEILGEVMGVSPNGKYVAVSDTQDLHAYIWDEANPGELKCIDLTQPSTAGLPSSQVITGASAMAVTDDGMVVGSIYYKDGHQLPAIYKDGEWKFLPVHEFIRNQNEAVCVTADGSVIAGYQFINDPTAETGGRFYPAVWTLGEDGEYTLESNNHILLPKNQGFYPMTLSPDGKVIGGFIFTDAGGNVPALFYDGDVEYFNDITTSLETWMYKGKYEGRDEDGKQIWLDDPDDPRVSKYEIYYVDGIKEGYDDNKWFSGAFASCDENGNFYGMRSRAMNVDPTDGTGDVVNGACIYNINTGEWIDETSTSAYVLGHGTDILFHQGDKITLDGVSSSIKEAFNFSTTMEMAGICKASADFQVLGGMTQERHPASGEMMYYPLIVKLDNGLVGVQDVVVTESQAVIIVADGRIEVANAPEATVYDLDGRLIGKGTSFDVASGIYVVKAGDTSRKVIVK